MIWRRRVEGSDRSAATSEDGLILSDPWHGDTYHDTFVGLAMTACQRRLQQYIQRHAQRHICRHAEMCRDKYSETCIDKYSEIYIDKYSILYSGMHSVEHDGMRHGIRQRRAQAVQHADGSVRRTEVVPAPPLTSR